MTTIACPSVSRGGLGVTAPTGRLLFDSNVLVKVPSGQLRKRDMNIEYLFQTLIKF